MHQGYLLLLLIIPALFFGIIAMYWAGRRMGKAHLARNPAHPDAGGSTIDAALLALLGLLMAFTFSGAGERLDARRRLIVEEANAISTAYLRIDLLPVAVQPPLRAQFRRYADMRIAYYQTLNEPERAKQIKLEAEALQVTIWKESIAAAAETNQPAPMMLVAGALNAMIDITSTRAMALITHPPLAIYLMLVVLALVCGLVAGFGAASLERPSRFHTIGFAAIVSLTIYLIVDLEFPRHGLVTVESADQVLIDTRVNMK